MTQIIPGINDRATLLANYQALQTALNDLLTGNLLKSGRHSIEQMEFQMPTEGQIRAQIADVAGQLAQQGVYVPGRRMRGRIIRCAP